MKKKQIGIVLFLFAISVAGFYFYLNGRRSITIMVDGKIVVPTAIDFTPSSTEYSVDKIGKISFKFYDSETKSIRFKFNGKSFFGWITPEIGCVLKYEGIELTSSESTKLILPFYTKSNLIILDKNAKK